MPRDFIEDLPAPRACTSTRAGSSDAMEGQREKARAGSAFEGEKGDEFTFASEDERDSAPGGWRQFDGYEQTLLQGVPVLALFDEQQRSVRQLAGASSGYVVLARTPFYLEAGGQVSDRAGSSTRRAAVRDQRRRSSRARPPPRARDRQGRGRARGRDIVTAEVDAALRDATRRNHTATHLLHAALRTVLGAHVKQAGSLVAPDRLRFDFVHFRALTPDSWSRSSGSSTSSIVANTPVATEVRNTQEAIAAGAMALFGEKYGDRVRVVSVPAIQRRTVRRHARARHRRHRRVLHHRGIRRRRRGSPHRGAHRPRRARARQRGRSTTRAGRSPSSAAPASGGLTPWIRAQQAR